jgi:hypothetical protein
MAFEASGLRQISDAGLYASPTDGGRIWLYRSADNAATVKGAGYLNGAASLNAGLKAGDLFAILCTADGSLSWTSIVSVTPGGFVGSVPTTATVVLGA